MHRFDGHPQQDHAAPDPVIGTVISEFIDDKGVYLVVRLQRPLHGGAEPGSQVSVAHHAKSHHHHHPVATSLGLVVAGKFGTPEGHLSHSLRDFNSIEQQRQWSHHQGFTV